MTTPVQPTFPISTVRPGDLITADFMNRLVNALNLVEGRVAMLEDGSAPGESPVINRVVGAQGQTTVRIGDAVRIEGRNFGVPAQNVVSMESFTFNSFQSGSGDRVLILTIPNLQGIPTTGRSVRLWVTNPNGSDFIDFSVFAAQATTPEGQLYVNLAESPTGQLNAGQSYDFKFRVRAVVNMEESYRLQPTIDQTTWAAALTGPATVQIPGNPTAGAQVDVTVRVTIPSGAPAGQAGTLRLQVQSQRNPQLSSTSGGDTLTVGQSAPGGQTEIAITCFQVRKPGNIIEPVTAGQRISIPSGTSKTRLDYKAHFEHAGNYTLVLSPMADSKWSVNLSGGAMQTALIANQDGEDVNFFVFVGGQAGAPDADVRVTVTKDNDATVTTSHAQPIAVQ